MLWNSINFWRVAALALFVAVMVLIFPYLRIGPSFALESSNMEIVEAPQYGARFDFTIGNDGSSGEAHVICYLYLYERGDDTLSDYTVIGLNAGETKSGELFIPLPPGQTVHDWRVEVN